jgi:hypothetical protein
MAETRGTLRVMMTSLRLIGGWGAKGPLPKKNAGADAGFRDAC